MFVDLIADIIHVSEALYQCTVGVQLASTLS